MIKSTFSLIQVSIFLAILVITAVSRPLDIVGYSSVSQINDIVERDGSIWIATPGGLINYLPNLKEQYHYRDLAEMPYLNITTLALDSSGNIWAGTEAGYLYRIDKNGLIRKNSDYFAKDWNINDVVIYEQYLLIGSDKGFSLFDTEKMKVVQNSTLIGTFSSPTINVIEFIEGSLKEGSTTKDVKRIYLGMLGGYAWYDIAYDDLSKENFYNSTIWQEVKDSSKFVYHITSFMDSLITSTKPVVKDEDSLYTFIDSSLFINGKEIIKFNSEVKCLLKSDGKLWAGTLWDFIYEIEGEAAIGRIDFNGLRFLNTNRVFIASDSSLWILPNTGKPKAGTQTPNIGLTTHKDGKWFFHEKYKNNFGGLSDANDSYGIAEDKLGNMWFGFNGRGPKKYDKNAKTWYRYEIAHKEKTQFRLLKGSDEGSWGKTDIILSDSLGYLWMGLYWGYDAGSLLCYDPSVHNPSSDDYRYFFPQGHDLYQDNLFAMSADACGNILIGGDASSSGGLVMFTYDENPIINGIETFPIYGENKDIVTLSTVYDIASAPDSTSWVASGNGLYIYSNKKGENLDFRSFNDIAKSGTINSIEIGELVHLPNIDSTFVTLWTVINNGGIIKSTVAYSKDNDGNIGGLRVIEDSTQVYTTDNGLTSNSVKQIYLDKKTGYVWAATNSGVAAIFDGNSYVERTDSRHLSAFPNPYIKKEHKKITFQHLAPEAQLMVYTLDGKLVANLNEDNSEMVKTGKEWTYYWTPSDKIKPGTYIYTGTTRGDKGYGKLLILP